jgi:hypothetical protein
MPLKKRGGGKVSGLTNAVGDIAGALRRRREDARPRVRIRVPGEQARVLADDELAAQAMLAAARDLVEATRRTTGDLVSEVPEDAPSEGSEAADAAEAADAELEAVAKAEASALPEPGPPAGHAPRRRDTARRSKRDRGT